MANESAYIGFDFAKKKRLPHYESALWSQTQSSPISDTPELGVNGRYLLLVDDIFVFVIVVRNLCFSRADSQSGVVSCWTTNRCRLRYAVSGVVVVIVFVVGLNN